MISNVARFAVMEAPPPPPPPPPEEVIGVFESGGLSNGMPAGYRILVTSSRLVGQKAWIGDYNWWATHPGKSTDEKIRARADKLFGEITSKKQFEIGKDDLVQLELKWSTSLWKSGYIKLNAQGSGEITIKSSRLVPGDLATYLTRSLQDFAGDKLRLVEK